MTMVSSPESHGPVENGLRNLFTARGDDASDTSIAILAAGLGGLLAARLERVSLDDIARRAKPNPLHPQHGAQHHG